MFTDIGYTFLTAFSSYQGDLSGFPTWAVTVIGVSLVVIVMVLGFLALAAYWLVWKLEFIDE